MPFDDRRTHVSPTGASLNLYVKHAVLPPRAVVQVNHGLAEHAKRYARFADVLAADGFHVYAHDHRGHGATRAPDAAQGVFGETDGMAKVIADVTAIHDLIAEEHPGLPIIVFGHSMGGLVALNFAFDHPRRATGLAIWNANFSAGLPGRIAQALLGYERFRLGSDVPSQALPRLTFRAWARKIPHRRTAFDWLSRDPLEVDKYIADPMCGWDASVSMWIDVFRLIFRGADDRRLELLSKDMPVSLAGGGSDPATDGGKAVSDLAGRMQRIGFSNLATSVYADTRHESLNDLNRDLITADFIDWARRIS